MIEKILIIAAHPDDEVLGCGGTIARMSREGHESHIAILGEGITSRYQERKDANPSILDTLHSQSREVAKLLGAKEVSSYGLPDNRFDTVPLLDIIKIIESLLDQFSPGIIYTHHGSDLNVDHQLTHRAVLTATRPIPGQPVRTIYAFEVPSSTEWAFQSSGTVFRPNVFLDITDTLEIKLQALSLYETEMRLFPHPRSTEAIGAIARRWGSAAGYGAAEAFELIRSLQ